MIPRTVLIAAGAFQDLSAQRVGAAIARGLHARGWETDVCAIVPEGEEPTSTRVLLDALHFDTRMRRARAVVLAEWRLEESTLQGSAPFEIATRARQGGVPAYAVTEENMLNAFDARMLDLQVILDARSARALQAAGRRLGELV